MGTLQSAYFVLPPALLQASVGDTVTRLVAPFIAAAACAVTVWLWLQLRRTTSQHTAEANQRDVVAHVQQARDAHLRQELAAQRAQLQEAKQALAVQRKKNHTLAEALRLAQQAAREADKQQQAAQNMRPAFSAPPAARPVPPPKVSKVEPPPPPSPGPTLQALQAECESWRQRHAQGVEALTAAKHAAAGYKHSVQRLQRRTEDMRRIELINRSKVELLEDKLRGLGRQYYEAISELALLKGEVGAPPGSNPAPSGRVPPRPPPAQQDAQQH